MQIFKIIADKRPSECLLCPIKKHLESNGYKCGEIVKIMMGKWEVGFRTPDDRCIIEVQE